MGLGGGTAAREELWAPCGVSLCPPPPPIAPPQVHSRRPLGAEPESPPAPPVVTAVPARPRPLRREATPPPTRPRHLHSHSDDEWGGGGREGGWNRPPLPLLPFTLYGRTVGTLRGGGGGRVPPPGLWTLRPFRVFKALRSHPAVSAVCWMGGGGGLRGGGSYLPPPPPPPPSAP